MKYIVIRTDTADALIRNIVLYIAENFGNEIALNKLDEDYTAFFANAKQKR